VELQAPATLTPATHWIWGCVGRTAGMEAVAKN